MTPGDVPLLRWLLLTASLFAAPACLPRHGVELPYGDDVRQRLDVYRPAGEQGPRPVVVFLYGGRWQHGTKRTYRFLGNVFSEAGVVAVVPDYRLYPEVRFPGWVEDAARVIHWVHDSIGRFGGNP
ncbi:MAG TPA: alpha/beta hydrolase, partial [Gemmatimonadales bacterium]